MVARWRRPDHLRAREPVPEILPDEVRAVRDDAIIATGRSDYPEPGQQRPRLPVHLPRRARRARDGVNEEMKMAATRALALLAKEDVPRASPRCTASDREVRPRLSDSLPVRPARAAWVAPAVAWAAVASGVAQEFVDVEEYRERLEARLGRARG
jgi:malate dehydrogenase (oxaloacetate-decarboxylating)(NADP+)